MLDLLDKITMGHLKELTVAMMSTTRWSQLAACSTSTSRMEHCITKEKLELDITEQFVTWQMAKIFMVLAGLHQVKYNPWLFCRYDVVDG